MLALLAWAGCGSSEKFAQQEAERQARLDSAYTAGMSRAEVYARLKTEANGHEPVPVLTGTRPSDGWSVTPPVSGSGMCARAEQRTSKVIASFERFSRVDGLFSLCYYWFYFDAAGTLVDAEWQYQSD